ncbi:sialate O-acetylesterase [Spirosoma radiotolerans]|nr:sialate O-acetylesterase [Spirosoma radiotolerans]
MVLQRDANNRARVQIAGSYSRQLDMVEARAVVRTTGQGTTTAWSTLQVNPTNGQFSGNLDVTGGWYKIQVRGSKGGNLVAVDSVERFGVGEVFAIIGHSNAQGSSCIVDGVNRCPSINGASDDRVTVIAVDPNTSTFQQYLNTADTQYIPGLNFDQLMTHNGSSPFGEYAWLWGHMGDELVRRLNVPVLLYNAGFGGTTMQFNYWAAYDIPFQHSFVRYDLRMPYANLRNLMNLYVPTTGIRAVLIQHGENDRGNPTDSTYKYYSKVIDKMRTEFNKPDLGCIVALSSFVGGRFDNVRSAQTQIINRTNYKAFQGPDLDQISSIDDRPDGIHFSPTGQVKAGDLWAAAISTVWASAAPYTAEAQPMTSLSCADSNRVVIAQPAGYAYRWSTGSLLQRLTVGAGTYSARIMNSQKKTYFPPATVVPAVVQPASPVLTTDNGTLSICRRTGLRLNSSYSGPNLWSTSATSSSIVVTTPGVYSVQAVEPVYGCLSAAVSRTVTVAPVDLSITLQTSRLAVALNDTVGFRLLVNNKSGCDAGSVSIQSRLPPNLTFVSAANPLRLSNNIVSGTISGLSAGTTVSQQYIARVTTAGTYRTTAEITSTVNPDINSTQNNGTANGEDDEAQTYVRTFTYSPNRYESANPGQVLLPIVRGNQPLADSTKADLSLRMQVSRPAALTGQLVDISLIVTNQGGLTATNVVVNNVLPSGVVFISSASGLTLSGSVLSGSIRSIPAGQSVSLVFTVRLASSGFYTNQAQIMSVTQSDPDSRPGNGYTNGEDDQCSVTLRTSS